MARSYTSWGIMIRISGSQLKNSLSLNCRGTSSNPGNVCSLYFAPAVWMSAGLETVETRDSRESRLETVESRD